MCAVKSQLRWCLRCIPPNTLAVAVVTRQLMDLVKKATASRTVSHHHIYHHHTTQPSPSLQPFYVVMPGAFADVTISLCCVRLPIIALTLMYVHVQCMECRCCS